jgi:hypothetical protein
MQQGRIVTKRIKMDHLTQMIKLQLSIHCIVDNIQVIPSELDCLSVIGVSGYIDSGSLSDLVIKGLYKSEQSARNALGKLLKKKLLVKQDKKWIINPKIELCSTPGLLLDLKALYYES